MKTEPTIKRTVSIKILPKQQKKQIDTLFTQCQQATLTTFNHIKKIYENYTPIDDPRIQTCYNCKKQTQLTHKHHLLPETICAQCFLKKWSWQTLTLKGNWLGQLIQTYPNLSPSNQGYYSGIIKFTHQMFKSWLSKVKEREKEIQTIQIKIATETNPLKQKKLAKLLQRKTKGIKDVEFKGNVIYFGSQGMFEFKKTSEGIIAGITDPHSEKKGKKISMNTELGETKRYKTSHNKHQIIDEIIETKANKHCNAKLLKRNTKFGEQIYEIMFPKKDFSTSLTTQEEVAKFFNQKPNTLIHCLSFGIKKPITIVTFKKGKIIKIKTIGNAKAWHDLNRQRDLRSKICKKLRNKHPSKWEFNKARKNFFKKRGKKEIRILKNTVHTLTKQASTHINKMGGLVVLRSTKGIKRISYSGTLQKILSRWNIELQKTQLQYKLMLRNIHIYEIKYANSNKLECSKCGQVFIDPEKKVKDKSIKNLTVKLNHGLDKKAFLLNDYQQVQRRLLRVQNRKTLPVKKRLSVILELSKKLKLLKDKLNSSEESFKNVKCSHCGYSQNFYVNDCINLYNKFYAHCHSLTSNGKTGVAEASSKQAFEPCA